jgi:hypothetical protein
MAEKKKKTKGGDDAADVLKRMQERQEQNPDACPFC